ncbi:hypothetical protein P3X46_006862 [Hevea brasiliensis]|uniref:Disease resistance protein RPM1-like n=1 Tax=Hevea brasiliensis TaxID=3981 RepID=A0ABQ9MUW4_HEVBR|nr:disease resistance protein RPM1 [Hevea brasiliensis]KAJ9182931.1 hypothetical protein P3X46_006862 [Hevea brasiliensis]
MTDAVVSKAIEKLDLLLTSEVKLLVGVHKEIADVKDELESIKSFLRDADARADQGVDSNLNAWVKQVRKLSYSIEDVIDDYTQHLARNRDRHNLLHKITRLAMKLKPRHQIASRIQEFKKSVRVIRERCDRYNFSSSLEQGGNEGPNTWNDPRLASLFIEEAELVGIEAPKSKVVNLLLEGTSKRAVISVVGMGGLGKTTLAKKVYDSERASSHFDCKAWITVSQSYKKEELLRTMIKQLQREKPQPAFDGIENMEESQLITKLREYLSEKRYIVVLDDVWSIDFWGYIRNDCPDNDKGSRIIITTRRVDVAPSSKESSIYHVHELQPLPRDQAFELFCKKVFQLNEGNCPLELQELSEAIVQKCEGLPLAIVTIGSLLATKDKSTSEWQRLCNGLGSALASDQRLSSIAKILSLSYHDLPYHLKSCFLHLSLFPENYAINCRRLIRLWIAEGFIKERQGVTLEDIAEEYLIELFHRSLVQVASVSIDGRAKECKVHDLVREVFLSVSKELSFHQVSLETYESMNGRIRHLSIYGGATHIPESSSNFQTHSIIVLGVHELPKSLVSSFFTNLKLLRALDFEGAPLDHIPKELGTLWHLRYLSLRRTKVKMIPTTIGKLCNLETLDLRDSLAYDLPAEINRLPELRHLQAYSVNFDDDFDVNTYRGLKMHGNIGCLKALQKLEYIEVDDDMGLRCLTQLRSLGITKLKREKVIALCSALEKMTCLRSLSVFSIHGDEFLDLESISNPLPLLQRLYLHGPLMELPNWIVKQTSLVKLDLFCSRLGEGAMQDLEALPNLQRLRIYKGYNGEQLHFRRDCFQKLKVLHLRSLTPLNVLIIDQGSLPLLEELIIGPCPNLKEVPSDIQFLRNLKKLDFEDIKREFAIEMLPDEGPDYWKVKHIPTVLFSYKITGLNFKYYKLGDSDLVKHLHKDLE